MARCRLAPLAAFLLVLGLAPSARAALVVKLGTRAPEGSAWHLILKEMGERWRKESKGEVVLRIYPNGVAGDEPDMVRAMRFGKLQAAALTNVGLSLISPEPEALSVPFLIRSYEELDYVRSKMAPDIERNLRERGFVLLNWGDAGWLQFFTTVPVSTPDELRRLKLFVWAGDGSALGIWKDSGFRPVPLASTDILPSLQTRMVDAVPTTALVAEAAQIFTVAKHMVELNWSPLVGGTVITAGAWEKVPSDLRPALLAAARQAGERLRGEIRRLDSEAVKAMQKRGLVVHRVDEGTAGEWRALAEKAYPRIRAEVVPPAAFDEVKRLVAEYRARRSAAGGETGDTAGR